LIEIDLAAEANFHKALEDHTAGDPMRLEVKWTNLSRRQIAKRMDELGTPVSRDVVSQWLRKHGYRRRKAVKKKTMGPRHPDRNAQFENIARLRKKYLKAGLPVISIDTKKKELIGDFYRDGVIDAQETIAVNDHDFGSMGLGTVIPHGIYDVGRNRGFVHLNTSHDTSELACDSIATWWEDHGRSAYPMAKKLLVLCDGGGSNSASRYVFKEQLQKLANRLGIEIRMAHYPPYCSKYNPIEHRLFPHVTRACRGVIFRTLETIRYYMSKTETATGLDVTVRILEKVYETGLKCADGFKKAMTIVFDKVLPKWNYRAVPETV
jgi:DDE family transposase